MNFRIGNMFRELSYSLRRNPSLFLGTLVVIAISLLILGSGLVVRSAVENATARWKDGVEFIVFLNPDSSQVEIDAVSNKLTANPEIQGFSFVNKQEAFVEFQSLFQESDQIRESVTVDDMPPSFRVVPRNAESSVVEALADGFRDEPGVFEVVAAIDTIRAIENVGDNLNRQFLVLGAKTRAILDGRFTPVAEDVKFAARAVLRHRIVTNFNAEADGVEPVDIADRLVEHVASSVGAGA